MITFYHNPRCSKSREALALVEQFAAHRQLALDVVEYLKNPPTAAQLATLQHQLGCDLSEMVRSNEEAYTALGLAQADDATLLQAVANHPHLLQRPIAVYQGRAAIGRPPEHILALLNEAAA